MIAEVANKVSPLLYEQMALVPDFVLRCIARVLCFYHRWSLNYFLSLSYFESVVLMQLPHLSSSLIFSLGLNQRVCEYLDPFLAGCRTDIFTW